jgi:hypothetical protein
MVRFQRIWGGSGMGGGSGDAARGDGHVGRGRMALAEVG